MLRPFLLVASLFITLVGCGSNVMVAGTGGASSSSGTGGCVGESFFCADTCGGDWFPAQAECVAGAWTCPPGTIDPSTCPSSTCWGGPPLPCEVCDNGWTCQPTASCLGGCPMLACAECPAAPIAVPGCSCACDANGQFSCSTCCATDMECGDAVYEPCVNGVCKPLVSVGCWTDVECLPNGSCVGAFVCPCGAFCDQPDMPGFCEGPNP